ncbi:MAG: hypothetical protein M0Q92_15765 [Methanoregula sp.]|jgi:hypothetical protein|nr:hypothetical protein [Methanoregula sp.]
MIPIKSVIDFEEWFKTLDPRDQAMILMDFANELYPAFVMNSLHDQMQNSNKKELPNIRINLVNNVKSSWYHIFEGCAIAEQQLKYAADFQSQTQLTPKKV